MENNKWNKNNALKMLLYAVSYVIGTVVTCVSGSIHPVLFVCYQITAGLLLSGIVIKAFDTVKAPGAAACFSSAMIIVFIAINDAAAWHVIPVVIIAFLAELIRRICVYSWKGDQVAAIIMTFSTFGYYGQIWFNRDYTYECAIEEMPSGYADGLMAASPAWALPVVIFIGIAVSVLIISLTAKFFRLSK